MLELGCFPHVSSVDFLCPIAAPCALISSLIHLLTYPLTDILPVWA